MASLQIKTRHLQHKKASLLLSNNEAFYVVLPGFEPGQTGPESVVLPLHHRTIFNKSPTLLLASAKVYTFSKFANKPSKKMSRKNTYVFLRKHVCVLSERRTCFF